MPPQPSGSQRNQKNARKASRVSTLRLDAPGPPAKKQKLMPVSTFGVMPMAGLGTSSQASARPAAQSQGSKKGKEKALEVIEIEDDVEERVRAVPLQDDRMWVDAYEPTTPADLAVHDRKVRDVRQWILEALESEKLRKYRRILALTGPAGTAKTATLRVLSREMDFDILEWRNSSDDVYHEREDFDPNHDVEYEGLSEKFHKFLTRAAQCPPLFPSQSTSAAPSSSQALRPTLTLTTYAPPKRRRQVILLEDLPNVLHPGTQRSFHTSLESIVNSTSSANPIPVIIIVSSAGVRGENPEDDSARSWRTKDSVDIRMVVPPSLWGGPYVTHIAFNAIAPTYMRPALESMLARHFKKPTLSLKSKGRGAANASIKEMLDLVIETSNGDIRSAMMALQVACTDPSLISSLSGKKAAKGGKSSRALLEAVTRREQSLALFHLLGKVLYNKRKGDAPSASMSKADAEKERVSDRMLKDPPSLPSFLQEHDRRASRVNIETLYADTPIDSSLLSLYIHQNYTQYCNTLEECAGVAEWLSFVDGNGGETIANTNPTRFHLITLGTLHALPTPVPRRGQRNYKPEFFDFLRKQREAEENVAETLGWLRQVRPQSPFHSSPFLTKSQSEASAGGWTARDVALELPALLKAMDLRPAPAHAARARPPQGHRTFSSMRWVYGAGSAAQLADEADEVPVEDAAEDVGAPEDAPLVVKESVTGGWLEEDDIEDF
ncbi:Rad17-domain-containing protein [Phanerochaete sordida]|uniref:Rad17-domain-containing protein n=1 Tax=Phanerochaete sordida TaxID=48140 RepID=A0A9P3LEK6_9APHY|nr:Rad17-domain-containing protein [Phanerochaete sordida]